MQHRWLWGDVPAGFQAIGGRHGRMMIVREGWERELTIEHFSAQLKSQNTTSPFRGRERLHFFRLDNGATALVRAYHHGGALRYLTGSRFFTWPPRPFVELAITEEVRRRGLPTIEIFAAWVERIWGPVYRGWLVSRELEGARDLWAILRDPAHNGMELRLVLESLARSLRTMHLRGVYHPDLNLKNLLVRREIDGPKTYIIDLDKARLFPGPVAPQRAEKNLRRLLRSASKLDPRRKHFTQAAWEEFMALYRDRNQRHYESA